MKYASPSLGLIGPAVFTIQSCEKEWGQFLDSIQQFFTTCAYEADE
jgi:hypothetical protein